MSSLSSQPIIKATLKTPVSREFTILNVPPTSNAKLVFTDSHLKLLDGALVSTQFSINGSFPKTCMIILAGTLEGTNIVCENCTEEGIDFKNDTTIFYFQPDAEAWGIDLIHGRVNVIFNFSK